MATTTDQELRRLRASVATTGSKTRAGERGSRTPHVRSADGGNEPRMTAFDAVASGIASSTRVTLLHPRPAPVEALEHLPVAVGFGSTDDLAPRRLWAVPGSAGHAAPVARPDDAGLDEEWLDDDLTGGDLTIDAWAGDAWAGAVKSRYGRSVGRRSSTLRAVATEPVRSAATAAYSTPQQLRPDNRTPTRSESAPLQLTARGRAVLLVLAAAVGAVVVVFAWFGAGNSPVPARAGMPVRVTVHDGDTLWSIAGKVAPNHDPRAVVARLLQLNHLHSPALVPGQVLLTR